MKPFKRLAAVMLTATAAACVTEPLSNEPLVWKPTSNLQVAMDMHSIGRNPIEFGQFRDVRANPQLIAENREDSTPKQVTTRDDVGAFVRVHLRQLFDQSGFNTVDSGGSVVLTGEVRQFFVMEESTYKGQVLLHLVLSSRDGKVLWEGTTSGSADRFGRSYSLENYYEVLSDSMINATNTLLQDYDFRNALAQH